MKELISDWKSSKRRLLFCAVDDSLIFGPRNGLEHLPSKIESIYKGEPDAVMTYCGPLMEYPDLFKNRNTIVNLSASTVRSNHTRKLPVHSIELAAKLGASSCAFHINLTSPYEAEMISHASRMVERCYELGMPSLGIVYPRREQPSKDPDYDKLKTEKPEQYAELVSHCISVGINIGFSMIKTQYTGNPNSFRSVVSCAGSVPVVVAGGPVLEKTELCGMVTEICNSGAAGICFGRNIFGRNDSLEVIRCIRKILSN